MADAENNAEVNNDPASGEVEAKEVDPTIIARAKDLGWAPREAWMGEPEKWVDAETFIERGEQILPIVRAENRRLREERAVSDRKFQELQEQVKALTEFNEEMAEQRAKSRKTEIAAGIRQAREDNDVEEELRLQEELRSVEVKPKKPAETTPKEDPRQAPEFVEWQQANPWFGEDQRRTDYAVAVAQRLRSQKNMVGKTLLTEVTKEVESVFGTTNARRNGQSKVEGSRGSGGEEGKGRSYEDLPSDARAQCDKQASRFVGKGKTFPDVAAWRKHFCTQYFR